MGNKIRIELDQELFKNLLLTCGDYEDPALKELYRILTDKLERMILREQYTAYKTSLDPEQKEQARQRYLDGKGIPEDFRWNE